MKHKRYRYSITEEAIMNMKFSQYRGGRVEVFDRKDKSGYAVYEGRFLIPEEIRDKFYDLFDGLETDLPLQISFDFDYEKMEY